VVTLSTGCVSGEFYGISALNPYTRQQWAKDERMGPTFHERISELRATKRSAKSFEPQQQERTVARMTELIRDDENPLIRAAGVRVLGEISTISALPGIQAAAVDADPLVRVAASEAFGRRADSDAATALSRLATDDADTDVRLSAVAALGNCEDQQAVQALSLALDDGNPAIQNRAVQSLKSSTGQSLGDNVAVWRAYLHGEPSPVLPAESLADRFQRIFY
jgi:HEAT repeat protein